MAVGVETLFAAAHLKVAWLALPAHGTVNIQQAVVFTSSARLSFKHALLTNSAVLSAVHTVVDSECTGRANAFPQIESCFAH